MSPRVLELTLALRPYDIVKPLDELGIAGANVHRVELAASRSIEEVSADDSWSITEVPLGDYVDYRVSGGRDLIALPVFPSRRFGHRSVVVRSEISAAADLRGKRVGVRAVTSTSAVWVRALLADSFDISPEEVAWVPTTSAQQQIEQGELDAFVVEGPTPSWIEAAEGLVRLFESPGPVERQYVRDHGVFPIAKAVIMRADLLREHRWLATNVYRSFEVARRRYLYRAGDIRASRLPIPSVAGFVLGLRDVLGPDIWPYGVAENKVTLEKFLEHHSAAAAELDVETLFFPVEPFVDGM